ncbi:MAG: nucleotide sugar dehydrogenase [Deltaproteobacteria bacterium]|nr:nucleotide sugar dehydrogenase [Deltaproteobacteria bacterium]
MDNCIAVVGLGYVGLPLALELAKKFPTFGFDINEERVARLKEGVDVTNEGHDEDLRGTKLNITASIEDVRECNFFIVGVPTPVDANNNPDLRPLMKACDLVGSVLQKGSVVVFESTVYPGVTEEICGPRLAEVSGLKAGVDFNLAYSPERINPGDKEHSLTKVTKVVSADSQSTLKRVEEVYSSIISAGIHSAPSIKVAEAAKVIENTQRDLNIALMNELAIIFDRIGIATRDVLAAAGTKWNFIKFSPGLVGGHCIGVDPYYLTTKAEQLRYHPYVILAGRRINDSMGQYVTQKFIKLMVNAGIAIKEARVGILGVTFKENVSDLRNSRVPDIISELRQFGLSPLVHDPMADPEQAVDEYGIRLCHWEEMQDLDGLLLAVSHDEYMALSAEKLFSRLRRPSVFIDVKSIIDRDSVPAGVSYWSL